MTQVSVDQALRLAVGHAEAGRLADAEQICRRILALQPANIDALHLLGVVAMRVGRHEAAAESFTRVTQLRPDSTDAHNNLGAALHAMGRYDAAVAAYYRVIQLKPGFAVAHFNLGAALQALGRRDAAIDSYQQAVRLDPALPEAHNNLGGAYREKGELDQAIASCRRAVQIKPGLVEAHNNLGNAFKDAGHLDEAIASFRRAVELAPGFAAAHSNLVCSVGFHPEYDAEMILAECRRWSDRHERPLAAELRTHPNDRNPDRPLRIGYVSPDFRAHVIGQNILPLLRDSNRAAFAVYCYSNVARPDEMTERFSRLANCWRSITGISDAAAAEMIRSDGIDILVDLALHLSGNRLPLFARKPAPVQMTFAGYPGGTGLKAIDYRLSDPFLDPPGMTDHHYVETTLRLSSSFWCYDPHVIPLSPPQAVSALPASSNGHVTFGCLGNFCKVNDAVLALWASVMRGVADSRLILLSPAGSHRQGVFDRLAEGGVESGRVEFVVWQARDAYFQTYHRIDLCLDTFPYNGHNTSLDAMWMGVPVVTLVGNTVVGRAGLSQLSNMGLTDLVARTPEQYISIATALAQDLPRLSALRSGLRQRMLASPLTNSARFTRDIEAAYRRAWRAWCA